MMYELLNDRRNEQMLNNLMMRRITRPETNSPFDGLGSMLRPVTAFFVRLYVRRKVYNELAVMSDHMLSDIGLTRADIGRIAEESARFAAAQHTGETMVANTANAEIVGFRAKKPVGTLVVERDAA